LAFAVWGLHVQASTTGGSEAIALGLMWIAFVCLTSALERPRILAFAAAAMAMNLAAATRYDAWMYIPLLAAMPFLQWTDRLKAAKWGSAFALMCLPFPLFWMAGNLAVHGDALYPLSYINQFHVEWATRESAGWRAWWFRAQGIGFWPAMALFTLTPGVAVLGVVGMARSWRGRPSTRWLTIASALPTAYYSLRSAIALDFVPLGRFTVVQLSLLLPFVWVGWNEVARRYGERAGRRVGVWTVVLAIVMPVVLGALTFRADHTVANVLKPVSPTTTNFRSVMAAARYLEAHAVRTGRTVALDEDPTYQDIQLGFYARLAEGRTLPLRWPGTLDALENSPPDYVVLFERGRLAKEDWIRLGGPRPTIAAVPYDEVPGFGPPVRVFVRR
jgi:hypothetical protein